MKKATRFLAALAAMTTLIVSAMPVSAYYEIYDLKNKEYCSLVGKYKVLYGEDVLFGRGEKPGTDKTDKNEGIPVYDLVTDGSEQPDDLIDDEGKRWRVISTVGEGVTYHHIYQGTDNPIYSWFDSGNKKNKLTSCCIFEEGWSKEYEAKHGKRRWFTNGYIIWSTYYISKDYNADDINKTLKDNGFEVTFKATGYTTQQSEEYDVQYPENTTIEDAIEIYKLLKANYNAGFTTYEELSSTQPYTDKGDVDLNGILDIADITTVAKYNLSNESYPLADDTAYVNADMNDDGIVDGLDTSALIENQLGKK